jgi:hypothetical protein
MDCRVIDLKEAGLTDEQMDERLAEIMAERENHMINNMRCPLPAPTCVWLTGNNLTRIPKIVLEMTSLESLYIGRNKLNRLPRELVRLKKLENLGFSNNPICVVPTEVCELSRLERLFADNLWTKPCLWRQCDNTRQVCEW